ncbi:hypothetical protein PP175_25380 (plasmid) [Aneurinibacillus sp. Ricciae_BoGa-3]|uniref:hypothetical protein n=1 Tax=Aneurinibacillus sp. Ricciae_BoGa-3 TaxID=3022697 RepID=UPI002341BEDB|nr:hypothetical protein [Aneurinibacillus sp. Ricciae_BoGa-3]WCK57402.1 hypothetical protein PP175_25380 [Aneurinibacillus sp. Ricciae_BoGa-3]
MHPFDWYQEQEKQREDSMKANAISLINRDLQRVLHRVEQHINREDYEKEAQQVNRHLVQSSIWRLGYRNNMENENVALEQALFIQQVLLKEELPNKHDLQQEVDTLMRRLGNVDWGLYGQYNRRKQMLK